MTKDPQKLIIDPDEKKDNAEKLLEAKKKKVKLKKDKDNEQIEEYLPKNKMLKQEVQSNKKIKLWRQKQSKCEGDRDNSRSILSNMDYSSIKS